MRARLTWIVLLVVVVLGVVALGRALLGPPAPPVDEAPPAPVIDDATSLTDEVVANILAQPLGPGTVADLALPEAFLERLADRLVRESYRRHMQRVVDDGAGGEPPASVAPGPPGVPLESVRRRVRRTMIDAAGWRDEGAGEVRPERRGFRAHGSTLGPRLATDDARALATAFAPTLAPDGLAASLASLPLDDPASAADLDRLFAAGFPVDLLDFLVSSDRAARRVVVRPTLTGFVVADESGGAAPGVVRVQATRGDLWGGVGAGGCLDVLRQLVAAWPEASFVIGVEDGAVDDLVATVATWDLGAPERVTILPQERPAAQWAQDNGKPGAIDGGRRPVTVVPRYPSRRDDGSAFVPGEMEAVERFAAAGHDVAWSSLLFQGGNLLAVHDRSAGRRVLLVGEAEIHRNVALGLSPGAAREAFRVEFGVDEVVVLPSISFHLDYDVSVRSTPDGVVALVEDPVAAARRIAALGVDPLVRASVLDEGVAAQVRADLAAARDLAALEVLAPAVRSARAGEVYPLSFARAFAIAPTDSPTGNLQRFLTALDVLAAHALPEAQRPRDRQTRGYFAAIDRSARDRARIVAALEEIGWTVVAVPSLSAGERSVTYLNGIHTPSAYLMPATGGWLAPLDAEVAAMLADRFGPGVAIVPVLSAESQRRNGAVHCTASVVPAAP